MGNEDLLPGVLRAKVSFNFNFSTRNYRNFRK
jgi:hypothetical protein